MTLAAMADARITRHDRHSRPVDGGMLRVLQHDRRVTLLLQGGGDAADDQRDGSRNVGVQHADRAHAVDPHHRGGRVADDAARAAGVRRRHDCGDVAHVHAPAEHALRDRATDQRRGDVVEEARQHEHQRQQQEAATPVVRQQVGQPPRQPALLEVARQQREPEQQHEQVGEHRPLAAEVTEQAGKARHTVETSRRQLVDRDRGEPGRGHLERAGMQDGNAEQCAGEQHELDGHGNVTQGDGSRSSSRGASAARFSRSTKSNRSTSVQ